MNEAIKLWQASEIFVSQAQALSEKMLRLAERAPLPENLRPATADDIQVDAIIWYPEWADNIDEDDNGNEIPSRCWASILELVHHGDMFKAYTAHDGCRYGLDGAFVEVSQ